MQDCVGIQGPARGYAQPYHNARPACYPPARGLRNDLDLATLCDWCAPQPVEGTSHLSKISNARLQTEAFACNEAQRPEYNILLFFSDEFVTVVRCFRSCCARCARLRLYVSMTSSRSNAFPPSPLLQNLISRPASRRQNLLHLLFLQPILSNAHRYPLHPSQYPAIRHGAHHISK